MTTAQLSMGLPPIAQRQFQPLLSKLKRPELVNAQGFINGEWVEAHGGDHFSVTGEHGGLALIRF